jgi:hypothetical protein
VNANIRAFVHALPNDERIIVAALRKVIHRSAPQAVETILWGGLSYHRPNIGGRVKGAVCQIGVKNGQVRLDFIHGIHLTDPLHLLQGNRLSKRFILISSKAEAERPEVAALIREAADVAWDD